MQATGFIHTIREIWWDVRPHHNFGTVEVRMCDMPGSLDDVLSLAALTQCLVKSLSDEIDQGAYQHDAHPMMVSQNKWRAARYGTSARLVDHFTFESLSVEQVVEQLVTSLQPTADELGCLPYLQRCRQIASSASWADRQLSLRDKLGDAPAMVRQLVGEARISPSVS
jgi:glutamate---cysteine ligase / carboxylate-amine ligase